MVKQRFQIIVSLLCLLFLQCPVSAMPTFTTSTVESVSKDGVVNVNDSRVHLYGVILPEKNNELRRQAIQFISNMLVGNEVTVNYAGANQDGLRSAELFVGDESDDTTVNTALLKAGLAEWNQEEAPRDERYRKLQEEAQKAKLGIWEIR